MYNSLAEGGGRGSASGLWLEGGCVRVRVKVRKLYFNDQDEAAGSAGVKVRVRVSFGFGTHASTYACPFAQYERFDA